MIMIIGSNHDDILYFESIMTNKKTETVFGTYKATIGNFFNQEVLLLDNVYTNYMSSSLVAHLVDKYFIILVIVVGKCAAYSSDLKIGDIVISRKIVLADVDQNDEGNVKLGQIPAFPEYFKTPTDVIGYVTSALESRTFLSYKVGTIVSSSIAYHKDSQIEEFTTDGFVFGEDKNVVFDSIAGGAAVATSLFNIPVVAVKIVSKFYEEKQTAKNYAIVLKNYAGLGKAIVNCVGDIGRNEIVRG